MEIVYIYTIVKDKDIMTTFQFNPKAFLVANLSAALTILTLNGVLQQVISFQDPLNELVFAALTATVSVFSIFNIITKK